MNVMKLVSWNVNGIRACVRKGFTDFFREIDADIFCIQETKCQEEQIELQFDSYYQYWNDAERKGYSGTAIFTKVKPVSVYYGLLDEAKEREGRSITLEFTNFYLVNIYSPNAQRDLARLSYRLEWEDQLRSHVARLESKKPVILCGDLNVAHHPIDLKNDKANHGNSGFTNEERQKLTYLMAIGLLDSFRLMHPTKEDAYTWWSYMNKVRERNIGWRIDYFLVSEKLKNMLKDAEIHAEVMGSDHCPISITVDVA